MSYDQVRHSADGSLPRRAAEVIWRCGALGTMYSEREEPQGKPDVTSTNVTGRLGLSGMVNICELLINAVIIEQAKGAERLEPKGKGAGRRGVPSPFADDASPVDRQNLTRSCYFE